MDGRHIGVFGTRRVLAPACGGGGAVEVDPEPTGCGGRKRSCHGALRHAAADTSLSHPDGHHNQAGPRHHARDLRHGWVGVCARAARQGSRVLLAAAVRPPAASMPASPGPSSVQTANCSWGDAAAKHGHGYLRARIEVVRASPPRDSTEGATLKGALGRTDAGCPAAASIRTVSSEEQR